MNNLETEIEKIAYAYDLDPEDVKDLTIGEICTMLDSKKEKNKEQMKDLAALLYCHAALMRVAIGSLLDKNVNMPSIEEAFPFLWDQQETELEKEARKEADEEIYNKMMMRMLNINKKMNTPKGP